MADGGGMRLEVEGLNRLVSTMRKAGIDLADMKEANRAAGEIVATAGRQVAPRQTGRLAASIRPAKQARRAVVRAGGGGVRYARFQEFGTRKNRATHFLYGSAARTQPVWLAAFERDLAKIIASIQGE
jgi:HK97 gp10 family phage protein